MKSYAILSYPGHNRVYFEESRKFSINELSLLARGLSVKLNNIETRLIAGIPYVSFEATGELSPDDLRILKRLSFFYALFEISDRLYKPIETPEYAYIDPGISSIMKYSGKTNEIFTRMLINIAVFSSDFFNKQDLRLLDPLAGKGTGLFEGLVCGYNVFGIEIGDKTVKEVYHFFKKYLEEGKYKHTSDKLRISGPNKSFTATKYSFSLSKTKEEHNDKVFKELEIVAGNSVNAVSFFKKNDMDIIVGDLPYGVQHGNVTNEKQSSLTRNPKQLLTACLPAWKEVLKPGGVMALSWNTFILNREDIINLIKNAGFQVFEGDCYEGFEHRVDQAVKRDIVVAKKY